MRFLRKDFPKIKKDFIDTGRLRFIFHPLPADLLTLQAMVCMERMSEEQKRDFLFSLSKKTSVEQMQKKMAELGMVLEGDLKNKKYLRDLKVLEDAFRFMNETEVETVPQLRFNGKFFAKLPKYKNVAQLLKQETVLQ